MCPELEVQHSMAQASVEFWALQQLGSQHSGGSPVLTESGGARAWGLRPSPILV